MPRYICLDMRELVWTSGPADYGGVVCFEEKEIEYYAVGVHRKIVIEAQNPKEAVRKVIDEYEPVPVHP